MYYLIHKGHFIKGDSILKGKKEREKEMDLNCKFLSFATSGNCGRQKKG
jgi:hypothetical protein